MSGDSSCRLKSAGVKLNGEGYKDLGSGFILACIEAGATLPISRGVIFVTEDELTERKRGDVER